MLISYHFLNIYKLDVVTYIDTEGIDFDRSAITIRTLKQRKRTKKGELKRPEYRQVPVPDELLNSLDYLFPLRACLKKILEKNSLLCDMQWLTGNNATKIEPGSVVCDMDSHQI
ncbi:MAG: hypothetical protein GY705_25170 [Bacteroidetes bacterium]|nr:hypothetical protein [Bacteroidota bacterium]